MHAQRRNIFTSSTIVNSSDGRQFYRDAKREFLDQSVQDFYEHFPCARCGLYLYDNDKRELALCFARGYEMFGKAVIVLRMGEGLVGRALAERRVIYTESSSTMPGYIQHHNFPDDHLQTLLAIPLLAGKDRIGVLCLQRETGKPFTADEISQLRQQAEEFALSTQNANAFLIAGRATEHGAPDLHPKVFEEMEYTGESVSHGWAQAESHSLAVSSLSPLLSEKVQHYPPAQRSLSEAVALVEKRMEVISKKLDERLPEAASMLFEATLMLLHDETFVGRMEKMVEAGTSVTEAICQVSREYIAFFRESTTEYIQEKAQDVEDLALRLLESATQASPDDNSDTEPHVVIAEHLLPYDVLRIAQGNIRGIVLVSGGSTAHVTLLVRSLKIPMMIIPERELLAIPAGEPVIIDCAKNVFIVHPNEATRQRYEQRLAGERQERANLAAVQEQTFTQDGVRIQLLANINIIADIQSALDAKAEGIGLYRTEFPFIMRQKLPTESEQEQIYSRILEQMPDRPVVFRTLDAGGDKVIPYLYKTPEENPALGLRSIRFSLKYPYILDQQLRAILRAIQLHHRHDVSILFPMISSIEELDAAKAHVESCIESIHAELGDVEIIRPKVGTMIELPAAVGIVNRLAEDADFFSIGSNDFIQYTLAVDRGNSSVSALAVAHHPAVLHGLNKIVNAALAHNISVSICGEMGRDPRYIPFLIGIGLRTFSMDPSRISKVQQLISRLSIPRCEEHAKALLSTDYISDIETMLDTFATEVYE